MSRSILGILAGHPDWQLPDEVLSFSSGQVTETVLLHLDDWMPGAARDDSTNALEGLGDLMKQMIEET